MVLQPMMWGMVPPWFKGSDPKATGLSTNNARLEGIDKAKLYKPCLDQNKRCVVVCDGFYEWKGIDNSKQPYLIYAKQVNGEKIHELRRFHEVRYEGFIII